MRYLKREEFDACRPLWEEAFPEDSPEFVSWYFDKKIDKSRVLVQEDEQGRICSMAFCNPYQLQVGPVQAELDYIVGVATRKDSRRQGYMRRIMTALLRDMQKEGKPFCYLMPASEGLYRPFGFSFIFDQPLWKPDERALAGFEKRLLRLDADAAALAQWMNTWLAGRFGVYALRDTEYMKCLQGELDSEEGEAAGWFDGDGGLQALEAFWGREKRERRFLYCREDDAALPASQESPVRPAIMARITCLASLGPAVSLSEDCPCPAMEVRIKIKDELLDENQGLWRWRLMSSGSVLEKIQAPAVSLEEGQKAAYNCMLNLLANLNEKTGDLNRIKRFVKVLAFVNSTDDFGMQPQVVNGGSNLIKEIFGEEAGLPARSAIGVNALPGGIACEIEVLVELK